jgi:phosphoadenosine phosphosulfate reductase
VRDDTSREAAAPSGVSAPAELAEQLAQELARADEELARAPASRAVEWAVGKFGRQLVLAASFQDVVLIDLAVRVDPGIEVVFCDTGAHFPETLSFVEDVRARFGLNLTITKPGPDAESWPCGSARCCEVRKVEPLRRALAGKRGWMTSLKRADAPTRASAPVVGWDSHFGVVKINPLATWTDEDVGSYLADHGLPVHPLVPRGYLSIGCAPTTTPVAAGEDPRAGRWAGSTKTECGLHAS